MNTDFSKQDYLKRYLDGDAKCKKRKKKEKNEKSIKSGIKIFDQDISIKSIKFGTEEAVEEDESPIVAEVVDERPVEVQLKEIYESTKWKRLGEDDLTLSGTSDKAKLTDKRKTVQQISKKKSFSLNAKEAINTNKYSEPSLSPVIKSVRHDSNSDESPMRRATRHDSDSDLSPQRQQPSRNKHTDSETPFLKRNERSSRENKKNSNYVSNHKRKNLQQQNNSDSDLSPERFHRQKSHDAFRPENCPNNNKQTKGVSARNYVPNSPKEDVDSDLSPPRSSPKDVDSDLSPPRNSNHSTIRENSQLRDENRRPSKTLSGLKAGLQNARTLREETKALREREKIQIKQLDESVSGRNADTIVRDRKTGKKRDIEEEERVQDEKKKKVSEQNLKYAEWGKGIEQTESKKLKLSDDLYETSKPLARYCDDEDLEERLKAEIRDDDPMAQYMRKKRQKSAVSEYPVYSGPPPPPNRFQIPPGYRWDGVDRSNGFEKKYFEQKSSKKAVEEEAYLWSVQNM